MARMLRRVVKVVAAGLLLGSCAAASPWAEWRETAMLLDTPTDTDTKLVRSEQLFDD